MLAWRQCSADVGTPSRPNEWRRSGDGLTGASRHGKPRDFVQMRDKVTVNSELTKMVAERDEMAGGKRRCGGGLRSKAASAF